MISHPYLHELFKACLLYDAEEVARMLCSYYPSWKLVNEWNIISVQQEFIAHKAFPEEDGPKFRKGDVVWLLAKVNVQGYLQKVAILHEVKTGNFDINRIFQKYKYYAVRSGCVAGGRTFLWIWGWREVLNMQQLNGEVERKIKYGFIRLLPLEILFPLVERKIKELIAQIIEYKRLEKES